MNCEADKIVRQYKGQIALGVRLIFPLGFKCLCIWSKAAS